MLASARITANMRIEEILERWPQAQAVFEQHGLPCMGCNASKFENVGEGARVHGIALPGLLVELNRTIQNALPLRGNH